MDKHNIDRKLKDYLALYKSAKKHPDGKKDNAFKEQLNHLFDISSC